MDCINIQEKLSAYLDGIISPEENRLVEEHLKQCPKCSKFLADIKKTVAHIQNLDEVEPPPWFTLQVKNKIKAEVVKKKSIFRKLFFPLHIKVPLQAAATVLIAITSVYIFKTIEPETSLVPAESRVPYVSEGRRSSLPQESLREDNALLRGMNKGQDIPPPYPLRNDFTGRPQESTDREITKPETERSDLITERSTEKRGLTVRLTIHVKKRETAEIKIRNILTQLGGKVIKIEFFGSKNILTAKLGSEKIKEMIEKLTPLGIVKKKGTEDFGKDDVKIEIEIKKVL